MPRRDERNIADVISETLFSIPGILQQDVNTRNQQLLQNLELMTGARERKAKSKHQKFMEELATAQAERQQEKALREQTKFEAEQEKDVGPLSSQGKQIQDLIDLGFSQEEAVSRVFKPDKPEDPQKSTRTLIDRIVAGRATKTKKVKGIESIEPGSSGLFGLGFGPDLFTDDPETTFVDQQVPAYGATELQALMENLNQAFGITQPDTTQGFDFDQIADPISDVLGRPLTESTGVSQQTLEAKRKRLAELKAKAGN